MQWWLIILIAALSLSVLKAALPVLLVLLLLALLWTICAHPREMLAFIGLLVLGKVLQDHGLAVLSIVGFLFFVALMRRPVDQTPSTPKEPKLLPKPERDST